MPRGDRTGPNGQGSKTGRRLGLCSGSDRPGFESSEPRRRVGFNQSSESSNDGQGFGRGQGRGGRGGGRGLGLGRNRG